MKDVIKYRRDLHMIPEASSNEYKTKEYILNRLKTLDCKIEELCDTGIIAYFDNNKKTTIALRADMDALPIEEINLITYASTQKGYSHACGHDGHMAMLLATADYLNNNKDIHNNVVLIFQPAEENVKGAKEMIATGFLKKYKVKHVFGMHIWPNLEKGKVYTRCNELMSSASEIDISIEGKAVHVAQSEFGIDSIQIASSFLNDAYNMEKQINNNVFRLLKFGKITGGTIRNVISPSVKIEGTLRTYSDEIFDYMLNNLKDIAKQYEKNTGCKITINNTIPCDAVVNDKNLAQRFIDNKVANEIEKPFLQAEDFGSYCKEVPSCFFMLGCGNETQLHTNCFNFDEQILEIGLKLYKSIIDMEF